MQINGARLRAVMGAKKGTEKYSIGIQMWSGVGGVVQFIKQVRRPAEIMPERLEC